MEQADDVINELKDSDVGSKPLFDVKARIASYARAKHISMTYLIMPVYSEQFFQALAEKIRNHKGMAGEGNTILNEHEGDIAVSVRTKMNMVFA